MMIGLRANIPRIEARRILQMARAFQITQPGSSDKATDLLEAAEVPADDRAHGDIQEWFEKQRGANSWPQR